MRRLASITSSLSHTLTHTHTHTQRLKLVCPLEDPWICHGSSLHLIIGTVPLITSPGQALSLRRESRQHALCSSCAGMWQRKCFSFSFLDIDQHRICGSNKQYASQKTNWWRNKPANNWCSATLRYIIAYCMMVGGGKLSHAFKSIILDTLVCVCVWSW